MTPIGIDAAVARARSLVTRRADYSTGEAAAGATSRAIIGIAGAPGAGKSTLAHRVAAAVPGAVVVGLDGFHLAHSVLVARGDVDRKGAIDTFDAAGYVALLERIRVGEPGPIWAPEFRRDLEDAIAGAVAVAPDTPLVITEGNYLLVDSPPWSQLPQLCDELWYAALPEPVRIERLVARHVHYGRTPAAALARATTGTDAINARLVARTAHRARHRIDVLGSGERLW
jgi:pantothenate kinase